MPAEHYTYRVSWSPADAEFVATCVEFPSLSWLAANEVAALRGITKLVHDVVADMKASGETVPVPIADQSFSGKFMVRLPPELHRRLAIEAAESKVSLNRYVNYKLSASQ
jgi:predicted HicB family RNase H-like nuclease